MLSFKHKLFYLKFLACLLYFILLISTPYLVFQKAFFGDAIKFFTLNKNIWTWGMPVKPSFWFTVCILRYFLNSLTFINLSTNANLSVTICNVFKLSQRLFLMNRAISSQTVFSRLFTVRILSLSAVIWTSSLLLQKWAFLWEGASSPIVYLLFKLRK